MPIIQVTQPPTRVISTIEFSSRLTDDEAVAIDLASIGDTEASALIRRYSRFMTGTSQVDLDSQTTRDGVAGLVAQGLLTEERANIILS